MTPANEDPRYLRKARLISLAFLAAPLVYIGILVIVHLSGTVSVELDNGTLNLFTVVLLVLGAFSLIQGFLFPRRVIRMARNRAPTNADQSIYGAQILRYACFEAISIYGLMLGILGSKLPILVPFFVVSLVAMVATFPNEDRWRSMRTEFNQAGTGTH